MADVLAKYEELSKAQDLMPANSKGQQVKKEINYQFFFKLRLFFPGIQPLLSEDTKSVETITNVNFSRTGHGTIN